MKVMYWFRNDLRVHDNPLLYDAGKQGGVIGFYAIDPRHYETTAWGFKKTEKFRTKFLLQSLTELGQELHKLFIPLIVVMGKPENHLPELLKKHQITQLYYQDEWTEEEVQVENEVKKAIAPNITLYKGYGQFLFHPDDIPYKYMTHLPEVFTDFRKKCEKYATIRPAAPLPKKNENNQFLHLSTAIPTLNQMGYEDFEPPSHNAFPFKGGELQAKARLNDYFWKTQKLKYYKKTRNGLLGTDYSSKFSAWLANGNLSVRHVYHQIQQFEESVIKNENTYWLMFELIWRDYFKYVSLKHGNSIFKIGGILKKDYDWGKDLQKLQQWVKGETTDDFVNANMIELATTGWMSNRGRQNVASYWSKEWKQDWRIGAAYFESMLIDYDVHSNWGNWMYNSGVGNDPRDRKFNTNMQAERYDPKGKFRKTWLQQTLF